ENTGQSLAPEQTIRASHVLVAHPEKRPRQQAFRMNLPAEPARQARGSMAECHSTEAAPQQSRHSPKERQRPAGAVTGDEVSLVDLLEQQRQIRRPIAWLEARVEQQRQPGGRERRAQRGSLALVRGVAKNLKPAVALFQGFGSFARAIGAAVVHQQHFVVALEAIEGGEPVDEKAVK